MHISFPKRLLWHCILSDDHENKYAYLAWFTKCCTLSLCFRRSLAGYNKYCHKTHNSQGLNYGLHREKIMGFPNPKTQIDVGTMRKAQSLLKNLFHWITSITGTPISLRSFLQSSLCCFVTWVIQSKCPKLLCNK